MSVGDPEQARRFGESQASPPVPATAECEKLYELDHEDAQIWAQHIVAYKTHGDSWPAYHEIRNFARCFQAQAKALEKLKAAYKAGGYKLLREAIRTMYP